jgi:hypothetical protein
LQHDLSTKDILTTEPGTTSRSRNYYALTIISASITILPERYVEELKSVDDSVANNAPFKNVVGDYNWYDVSHNRVFRQVINAHLTPKLSSPDAHHNRQGRVCLADGIPHLARMDEMSLDGHLQPFCRQAELQLIASLAAIHTTTLTTTNFLYDLVTHPEYFETLRHKAGTV